MPLYPIRGRQVPYLDRFSLQYFEFARNSSPVPFPFRHPYLWVFEIYPGRTRNIRYIDQLGLLQLSQKPGLFSIMGIHPHKRKRGSPLLCFQNTLQPQLSFGAKLPGFWRNACLFTPLGIINPLLRQIQTAFDQSRFSGSAVSQEYTDLAVVHLPQSPTILTSYAYRLPCLGTPVSSRSNPPVISSPDNDSTAPFPIASISGSSSQGELDMK